MQINLSSLEDSVVALKRSVGVATRSSDHTDEALIDTLRSGVIQNFEVAFEQSWLMMKRWLEMNVRPDITFGITKKQLFRICAENALIADSEKWFFFQNARNKTSHIYSNHIAEEVYQVALTFVTYSEDLLVWLKAHNE